MDVYDTYEGNAGDDEALAAAVDAQDAETVTLDDDQRRRSRVRTETDEGTEVGIVVGRELHAGDVLATADGDGPLVEVALEPIDAVVVDLADAETGDPGHLVTAVALGHAAGNRHWDMAVRDKAVLFPASESDARIDATIEPHLPEGATVDRESVSPAVFDDGGPGVADHSHGHSHDLTGDGHGHSHGDDHEHDHDYDAHEGGDAS